MIGEDLQQELNRLLDAAWIAAAYAASQRPETSPEVRELAAEVLLRAGLPTDPAPDMGIVGGVAAQLRQAASFATGELRRWSDLDDATLQQHGATSRLVVEWLTARVIPTLPGLADRLERPGAAFLDVGTGVGELGLGFVRRHPELRVVGLDRLERALRLARRTVAAAGVHDRFEVRDGDVADLDDDRAYDLVWLPVPFVAEAALRRALPRLLAALRPDGWLVAAAAPTSDLPLTAALHRMCVTLMGGCPWTPDELAPALRATGFVEVRELPAPSFTSALVGARRGAGSGRR